MSGTFYVIGTPIGNLGDITLRQLETLKNVDFVCAEDTRVTVKIFNHFDIKKPLVSYHKYSTQAAAQAIIDRILSGEDCGIVTDAGMPCISDPGEKLVKMCVENNINIIVVPGPTAVASAVAVSGMNTERFMFEGFIPIQKKERRERLELLADETGLIVFYEAPHKLKNTLADLRDFFGADRRIAICRELTKIHEEVLRFTLGEAAEYYESIDPKGEFVLVLEGKRSSADDTISPEQALEQVRILVEMGERPVDACKEVAKACGLKKSDLYTAFCKK